MAFGQASGPPASAKLVARIVELLEQAGYDLREARHPYGLTQRQANGKFTSAEANELIERLEAEQEVRGHEPPAQGSGRRPAAPPAAPRPVRRPARAPSGEVRPRPQADDVVTAFPDELLAEELTRRGWSCTPPPSG